MQKRKIKLILLSLIFSIDASAQSFMTNTVTGTLKIRRPNDFSSVINDISRAYNVRICSEDNMYHYISSMTAADKHLFRYKEPITFTDMAFSNAFEFVMIGATNHVWIYENSTDTIYIHPTTNSFSMMRCAPIAITNAPILSLFLENDIMGLKQNGVVLNNTRRDYSIMAQTTISLELTNAFVWQVLEAICEKLPDKKSWHIQEVHTRSEIRYLIYFN